MSTNNVLKNVLVLSRTNFVTFSSVQNSNEQQWKLFGLWLKAEREKAGKTQEQVAEDADLHPKTVSRIENGEPTKRPTVAALAKAVNTDINEAIRRAFAPNNGISDSDLNDSLMDTIYYKYNRITPVKREELRRILEMVDRELDAMGVPPEKNA